MFIFPIYPSLWIRKHLWHLPDQLVGNVCKSSKLHRPNVLSTQFYMELWTLLCIPFLISLINSIPSCRDTDVFFLEIALDTYVGPYLELGYPMEELVPLLFSRKIACLLVVLNY